MIFVSLPRFIANPICAFIPGDALRKRVRVILCSPYVAQKLFIMRDAGVRYRDIKTTIGYRGRNLVMIAGKKYVYKFLTKSKRAYLCHRERIITDALRDVSPIHIPEMKIFDFRGVPARRYEYINGKTLPDLTDDEYNAHKLKLARTVANFIYSVACADPQEIKYFKPNPKTKPSYMHGWWQGDICDNFMIDTTNYSVRAFIDWEDAVFNAFSNIFTPRHHPRQRDFMAIVAREYDKLYNKKK